MPCASHNPSADHDKDRAGTNGQSQTAPDVPANALGQEVDVSDLEDLYKMFAMASGSMGIGHGMGKMEGSHRRKGRVDLDCSGGS